MPYRSLLLIGTSIVAALTATTDAFAADAVRGKQLAQMHCAACHTIAPQAQKVVALAPPFDVIGRKYNFEAGVIATAIAGPHPKMNFRPRRDEAEDIAAYIAGLRP